MSASGSGCVVSADAWPAGGVLSFAGLGMSAGGGDEGVTIGDEMEDTLWAISNAFLHKCVVISYLG